MMDISKADDIHIGNVPVQSAWLGGRKVWDRTERRIMRSMVCWYDISRQGCTNEAMAQNPVLKDLSGNGNDMTCYNFAWSGMSGIGGYSWDFTDFTNNYTRTASKVVINTDGSVTYNSNVFQKRIEIEPGYVNRGAKVKVTGITGNGSFDFYNGSTVVSVSQDGEYEVDDYASAEGETYMYYGFKRLDGISAGVLVEIELVPDYPGALVYDGVDDKTTPVPAYPKNVGTAFIVIRQIEGNRSTALYQAKTDEAASPWRHTGVIRNIDVCLFGPDGIEPKLIYSDEEKYGRNCVVFTWDNALPKMTAELNGRRIEIAEENLHYSYSFMIDYNNGSLPAKGALYKYILFDRTLTDAEIDWVKENLVEPPLPQPLFYYDFSKYRRQDFLNADEPVLQDQAGGSNTLTLYNQNKAGCGFEVGIIDFTNLIQSDQSLGLANANSYTTEPQKMHLTRLGGINGNFHISQVNGNLLQYKKDDYIDFKVTVNSLPPGVEIGLEMYSSGIGGGPVKTVYVSESCIVRFEEGELGNQFNVASRAADGNDEITPCDCDVIIESVNSNFKGAFFTGGYYYSYMKGTFAPSSGASSGKCTLFMLMNLTYRKTGCIADFGNLARKDGPEFAIVMKNDSYTPDVFSNDYNSNDIYINNRYNDLSLDWQTSKLIVQDIIGKKVLVMIKGDVQKDSDVFTVGCVFNEEILGGFNSFSEGLAVYKILMFNEELTQEQIDRVIDKYSLMKDVDDAWARIDGTEGA